MSGPAPQINLENIENDILIRMNAGVATETYASQIEVELMPDTPALFKRPLGKKGRISICYMDTDFDKQITTNWMVQPEYNRFGFFLVAKTRFGDAGVYDLYRIVRKWMVGYPPMGHTPMTAKKTEMFLREADTGLWFLRFELSARGQLVQYDNSTPEPPIVSMTFKNDLLGDVVVNEDTVRPPDPLG